jgi:hypothetical protein
MGNADIAIYLRAGTITRMKRAFLAAALILVTLTPIVPTVAQQKTFVEPTLYVNAFKACGSDDLCTRTADFSLKSIPNGCCVLEVLNGGGSKDRQVSSYEIYLNGERVITPRNAEFASAAVKLSGENNLKVVLKGKQEAAIAVMFAYNPRQPK